MKILIITNIPNPYRIPLFNKLNSKLQNCDSELLVAFGGRSHSRRLHELNVEEMHFPYIFLGEKYRSFCKTWKKVFTYPGTYKILTTYKPDKIIVVGYSIATLKLFLRSLICSTQYIIWSGSTKTKGRKESAPETFKRKILIRRASAFLAYGAKAREYLIEHGADPQKISIAINTVDVEFYDRQSPDDQRTRQTLTSKIILYVGYLTKGKRIDLILNALRLLSEESEDFLFLIVGDGPERQRLKDVVDKSGLSAMVKFVGFVQKSNLPIYYSQAACFVFASEYDIWGLVINEAMASGIPCICSKHAGAGSDLIHHPENGFIIDFEDANEVKSKISLLLNDPSLRDKMGHLAQAHIRNTATLDHTINGFWEVMQKC